LLALPLLSLSCDRRSSPQADFAHAYRRLVRGELIECRQEANDSFNRFHRSNPQWAIRFRILEARALLEQGQFQDSLKLADDPLPGSEQPEFAVSWTAITAVAMIRMHNLSQAEVSLRPTLDLCSASDLPSCGDLFQAAGILFEARSDWASAEKQYTRSLLFARSHGDRFLESNALLNLGNESLIQDRFDEAVDRSEAAYRAAEGIDARVIALVAQGNIGWACYRLGDFEKAMSLSLEAEKAAADLDDVFDRENLLTNIGYIYMDQRQFDLAARNFQQALKLAEDIKARQDIYNALRVLARLELQMGNPDKASQYASQALSIARESGNHVDELYPMLVQGQVASRRGDAAQAEQVFEEVEQDKACPVFLKWDAQHSLARLYEDEKQQSAADREYRAALATFESARATVQQEDFQLSFLTNAARIYDDYVHFLVAQGKTDEALRWADYSRARALSEGLGLLSKEAKGGAKKATHPEPPVSNARAIAAHAKGVIFYYWLGEKQSYLWAITTRETKLFTLPAGPEIEATVQRYRKALTGPTDVLESANEDGRSLYRTLISPAQSLLTKNTKVFVIPDGNLNGLNFETLIVSDPAPHYWIEDAVVIDSGSLRLLSASYSGQRKRSQRSMLLIGNSVAPSDQYPALPNAQAQMDSVARHFTNAQRQIASGSGATPAAYFASRPELFSHIHFVAHGTASRLSPLDSAIVLSRDAAETDSFKLYARDIIQHPLHADLVTISACYGAGERSYSGEGLVGLAWAFLRAGAHNVIAGLWEVTDASTEQLMDRFYDELDKGSGPDAALRAAKLSLLRGRTFRHPFYWAPFQLYAGS
jgi:CHAT domain-containing protein